MRESGRAHLIQLNRASDLMAMIGPCQGSHPRILAMLKSEIRISAGAYGPVAQPG